MSSSGIDQEEHIITAIPTVDKKSKASMEIEQKEDIILGEKLAETVEVTVSEYQNSPSTSRRQRYALFARSLCTDKTIRQTGQLIWKFGKFTGPGAIISVAYIDPDNYQTAVSSGAEFKYKLLFAIFFSNVVAVYLQVSIIDPY
jgi:metal iron transporter